MRNSLQHEITNSYPKKEDLLLVVEVFLDRFHFILRNSIIQEVNENQREHALMMAVGQVTTFSKCQDVNVMSSLKFHHKHLCYSCKDCSNDEFIYHALKAGNFIDYAK